MRRWLEETHGADFELLRHFVLRFFDSDLVTTRGQWTTVMVGNLSLMLPVFFLIAPALMGKYRVLSRLGNPEFYRHAVRADELWLITLGMSAIGLLAAVKWQSLFPGLRDYLALGALPVRPRQIFVAKLLALLLLASATIVVINALPSVAFPFLSSSRWQVNPSLLAHIAAQGASCVLASYFFFFGVVACQGLLLNLLPPRLFARITGYAQGALITVMLGLMVLSLSIGPNVEMAVTRPELSKWLPPVWFLGLYQKMLGDPNPLFGPLADKALAGLAAVVVAALLSYLVSYHRHRELLMEGVASRGRDRKLGAVVLDRLVPDPRQQGVLVFLAKTLARSGQHRMLLMGYVGFSLALALSGMIGISRLVQPGRAVAASFVYAHMVTLIFLLIGLRHLFAIPAELCANWTFQITEREGRREWFRAIDRFVLFSAALAILVIPFPLEAALLGWLAVGESILFVAALLLYYEILFNEWEKLPFTCSYLPGKTPGWILVLVLIGILGMLPIGNVILVSSLYNRAGFAVVLAMLLAIWSHIRHARKMAWGEVRLIYEDAPEPAVRGLNLGTN